jgi:phage shock protein PspC (stress-responsive transcriptional regulator)
MNKVININFQGRVIPIEEPAYDELKKYIDSLRSYFANEDGKEEIVNDIENRIAELFSEKLKAGQSFISEAHVAAIIASMGRPEQFDELAFDEQTNDSTSSTKKEQPQQYQYDPSPRGSLFRNANDKMLGGVCSGIGAYLKIDTTLVRVLFAILAFGAFGTGLVLYIILWAILPSRFLSPVAVTRKLYRDADQKVIGGVSSGIAQYFNIAVWIPRLIFALPLVIGIAKIPFTILFFPVAASFSGTIFLIYIILWIVVPKAVTASEKLEMKGQTVNLESIKHKVQDELQGVKKNFTDNASTWKNNIGTKVDEWGKEFNDSSQKFRAEADPAATKIGNKILRFILTLFKIFFLFIFSIIAIALIVATFGMGAVANALMPLKNFIADGNAIQWYAWGTLVLFILVPIIAIVQWLIRAIIGHKTKSNAIGITLGSLWALGWVALVMLVATVSKQFKRPGTIKEEVAIVQPSANKLKIEFKEVNGNYYPLDLDWDDDFGDYKNTGGLLISKNEDSLLVSNIRVKIEKSNDSFFHVTLIKRARSSSPALAEGYAEKISYTVSQQDSILQLPFAFPITTDSKFRNQQVLVKVQVPVGKEVYIDKRADELSWYSVRSGARGLNINIDQDYDDEDDSWRPGVWYIMKADGIEKKNKEELSEDERLDKMMNKFKNEIKNNGIEIKEIDIKVKDGDTSINVNLNTFLPKPPTPPTQPNRPTIEKNAEEEQIVFSSPSRSRRLLFGAINLLKVGM